MALFAVTVLFVSCGGKEDAPKKENAADSSLDFESIDDGSEEEPETDAPVTEAAPETKAPEKDAPAVIPTGSSKTGLDALLSSLSVTNGGRTMEMPRFRRGMSWNEKRIKL